MTPAERAAIEARANAATPGPWTTEKPKAHDDGWARGVVIAATYGGQAVFVQNGPRAGRPARIKPTGHVYADATGGQMPHADQWFIAAARTDIPALLEEVKALNAELDSLRTAIAEANARLERHTKSQAETLKTNAQRVAAVETLLEVIERTVILDVSFEDQAELDLAVIAVRKSLG